MAKSGIEERIRKVGIVDISPEFLFELMKPTANKDAWRCVKGLPEESKLIRAGYDHSRDRFFFVIEAPGYPTVPYGKLIPALESPAFEIVRIEQAEEI